MGACCVCLLSDLLRCVCVCVCMCVCVCVCVCVCSYHGDKSSCGQVLSSQHLTSLCAVTCTGV